MQQVYQVGSQFDSEVALNQKLTFDAAKMKFLQSSIAFDEKALQLFHDQDYNNAALLLSDQCQEVTKVAVFEGKEVDQFLDKRAYTGSIVTQIDATLNYLDSANHRRAIITGEAQRSERQDYPETAIREAVVNAFIHRDYMLHSNVKVEVFDDRLEILSPGGIPQGLIISDIENGLVAARNPRLVHILDKMGYLENYGTGLKRIVKAYAQSDLRPEIKVTENSFLVTLPNLNG